MERVSTSCHCRGHDDSVSSGHLRCFQSYPHIRSATTLTNEFLDLSRHLLRRYRCPACLDPQWVASRSWSDMMQEVGCNDMKVRLGGQVSFSPFLLNGSDLTPGGQGQALRRGACQANLYNSPSLHTIPQSAAPFLIASCLAGMQRYL